MGGKISKRGSYNLQKREKKYKKQRGITLEDRTTSFISLSQSQIYEDEIKTPIQEVSVIHQSLENIYANDLRPNVSENSNSAPTKKISTVFDPVNSERDDYSSPDDEKIYDNIFEDESSNPAFGSPNSSGFEEQVARKNSTQKFNPTLIQNQEERKRKTWSRPRKQEEEYFDVREKLSSISSSDKLEENAEHGSAENWKEVLNGDFWTNETQRFQEEQPKKIEEQIEVTPNWYEEDGFISRNEEQVQIIETKNNNVKDSGLQDNQKEKEAKQQQEEDQIINRIEQVLEEFEKVGKVGNFVISGNQEEHSKNEEEVLTNSVENDEARGNQEEHNRNEEQLLKTKMKNDEVNQGEQREVNENQGQILTKDIRDNEMKNSVISSNQKESNRNEEQVLKTQAENSTELPRDHQEAVTDDTDESQLEVEYVSILSSNRPKNNLKDNTKNPDKKVTFQEEEKEEEQKETKEEEKEDKKEREKEEKQKDEKEGKEKEKGSPNLTTISNQKVQVQKEENNSKVDKSEDQIEIPIQTPSHKTLTKSISVNSDIYYEPAEDTFVEESENEEQESFYDAYEDFDDLQNEAQVEVTDEDTTVEIIKNETKLLNEENEGKSKKNLENLRIISEEARNGQNNATKLLHEGEELDLEDNARKKETNSEETRNEEAAKESQKYDFAEIKEENETPTQSVKKNSKQISNSSEEDFLMVFEEDQHEQNLPKFYEHEKSPEFSQSSTIQESIKSKENYLEELDTISNPPNVEENFHLLIELDNGNHGILNSHENTKISPTLEEMPNGQVRVEETNQGKNPKNSEDGQSQSNLIDLNDYVITSKDQNFNQKLWETQEQEVNIFNNFEDNFNHAARFLDENEDESKIAAIKQEEYAVKPEAELTREALETSSGEKYLGNFENTPNQSLIDMDLNVDNVSKSKFSCAKPSITEEKNLSNDESPLYKVKNSKEYISVPENKLNQSTTLVDLNEDKHDFHEFSNALKPEQNNSSIKPTQHLHTSSAEDQPETAPNKPLPQRITSSKDQEETNEKLFDTSSSIITPDETVQNQIKLSSSVAVEPGTEPTKPKNLPLPQSVTSSKNQEEPNEKLFNTSPSITTPEEIAQHQMKLWEEQGGAEVEEVISQITTIIISIDELKGQIDNLGSSEKDKEIQGEMYQTLIKIMREVNNINNHDFNESVIELQHRALNEVHGCLKELQMKKFT